MIRSFSLSEASSFLKGTLIGDDREFSSVNTDTRSLNRGQLFVALTGESFDGHEYVEQALSRGACGVVVDRDSACEISPEASAIKVEDTGVALGRLGLLNRTASDGTVISVTGSSGKTTVKNMLSAIFAEVAPTVSTPKNMNNEVGVPLTLLGIEAKHRYAVVEMGARAPGDISYLARITKPDVAVLLNAGSAHIGEFGSYENIVATKGEVLGLLDDSSLAIINADDPACEKWKALASCKVVTYSLSSPKADVYAQDIKQDAASSEFLLCYKAPDGSLKKSSVRVSLPGLHNISNAICAATVATQLNIGTDKISGALGKLQAENGRLRRIECQSGLELIDDTYNANPDSVKASLRVLALSSRTKKVAVLGSMAELGEDSHKLHYEVGQFAAEQGIDELYACGPYGEQVAQGYGHDGQYFASRDELIAALLSAVSEDETILVKGSRVEKMEKVVEALNHKVNN